MKKLFVITLFLTLTSSIFATEEEDFLTALYAFDTVQAQSIIRNSSSFKIDFYNKEGYTAIIELCRSQQSNELRWLLEQGADPNKVDVLGIPPLLYSAASGNKNITQQLLLAGAYINALSPLGESALQAAANNLHFELAQYLEGQGGQILGGYYNHPLISEIWEERAYYKEALSLKEERWPSYPIIKAVVEEDYSSVRKLIREGYDVNSVDSNGISLLMMSSYEQSRYIADYLIEEGADINQLDSHKHSPLWYAAFNGQMELVEKLIAMGADLGGDYFELSPLFAAFAGQQHEVISCLIQAGADPLLPGRMGNTLVNYASFWGDMATIKIMDELGVNLCQLNLEGLSGLDSLVEAYRIQSNEERYLPIAQYLKDEGLAYSLDLSDIESERLVQIITSIY